MSASLTAPLRRIAALALAFALLLPLPALAGDPGVLVIGRISDDPKAHYEQLKSLLDYVVPRMKDVGIREGRILMAKDATQMASYLRRGRVDWVTETAGTGMLLKERAGAKPLLLTERDGTSHYHAVFFARADSDVRSLDDMRGHSVAFQRPSSTSAYFLPATELLHRGNSLELLLSPTDRLDSGVVGYVFARSELNIATWVHKRLVDVGVMSNLDWENPRRVPAAFRPDLRVIGRTGDVPRALELVRSDLDPKVEARLREVLLGAAGDPQAHDALLGFFQTTRFLPMDAESRQALDELSDGVGRVRREVE
ncbi:phosphate/phosphite/phosphonate ABC transporter substrate-binding protein [Lysobacter yangpyeongensis]|uniref:Phosphate/phosphite/phosphonate ABC transporter substrate-binding protein n=1 Tax=Lysobacter yangpyeongensis TaxID=346182 RepID=A0ABW0SP04_9GAMM